MPIEDISNEELLALSKQKQPKSSLSEMSNEELLALSGRKSGPSVGETIVDQGLQGITLGFADEIGSFKDALVQKLRGNSSSFEKIYDDAHEQRQKELKAQRKAHGGIALASEIGGAVLNPLNFIGVGAAGTAAKVGGIVGRAALEGAVYGAGTSEERGLSERLKGAAGGAALGAAGGVAAKGIGKGLKKIGSILSEKNALKKASESLFNSFAPTNRHLKNAEISLGSDFKEILGRSVFEEAAAQKTGIVKSRQQLFELVQKGANDTSEQIGDLIHKIDVDTGRSLGASGFEIGEEILQKAKRLQVGDPAKKPLTALANEYASGSNYNKFFDMKGLLDQKSLQGKIAYSIADPSDIAAASSKRAREEVRRIFDNKIVNKVVEFDPKLADELAQLNDKAHLLKTAEGILFDTKGKGDFGQSMGSLVTNLSVATTAGILTHPMVGASIIGGRYALSKYGKQSQAALFKRIANNPQLSRAYQEAIGKSAPVFGKAPVGVLSNKPF